MTREGARDPSGESGTGATHRRPVPRDTKADSDDEDHDPGDGPTAPRSADDGRPIDVAPRTGPFEMGTPEAGMPPDEGGS